MVATPTLEHTLPIRRKSTIKSEKVASAYTLHSPVLMRFKWFRFNRAMSSAVTWTRGSIRSAAATSRLRKVRSVSSRMFMRALSNTASSDRAAEEKAVLFRFRAAACSAMFTAWSPRRSNSEVTL